MLYCIYLQYNTILETSQSQNVLQMLIQRLIDPIVNVFLFGIQFFAAVNYRLGSSNGKIQTLRLPYLTTALTNIVITLEEFNNLKYTSSNLFSGNFALACIWLQLYVGHYKLRFVYSQNSITLCCKSIRSSAFLWCKMPMFRRAGMREGGKPLPLALQYLIFMV